MYRISHDCVKRMNNTLVEHNYVYLNICLPHVKNMFNTCGPKHVFNMCGHFSFEISKKKKFMNKS